MWPVWWYDYCCLCYNLLHIDKNRVVPHQRNGLAIKCCYITRNREGTSPGYIFHIRTQFTRRRSQPMREDLTYITYNVPHTPPPPHVTCKKRFCHRLWFVWIYRYVAVKRIYFVAFGFTAWQRNFVDAVFNENNVFIDWEQIDYRQTII